MKSVFTTNDIKNIVYSAFKEHSVQVPIVTDGQEEVVDISEHLNIEFYTFVHYLEMDKEERKSLSTALDKSYAIVETGNESANVSADIDFVEKEGTITFIVQDHKVRMLDYFITRLRSIYLGQPQKIKNNFGEVLNLYLIIGIMQYETAPETTGLGDTVVCRVDFKITYLTNTLTYSDYDVSLSFDGTNFMHLPFNELSLQIIFASDALPRYAKNDIAGIRNKTADFVASVSFYDFLKEPFRAINDRFMRFGATRLNGQDLPSQDINKLVYLRIIVDNGDSGQADEYVYLCTYNAIQKKIENASYSTMSLTLKGSAVDLEDRQWQDFCIRKARKDLKS
ncbi:MAG: hypothetical protein LBK70_00340 [Clostridiales bacterium]|jgi:hypothetical protein|nr:hypothetical protein [Clostridiales bacterium]